MQVEITQKSGITILSVKGKIDTDTAPNFEEIVTKVIDEGKINLLMDCSELEYISSSGLRVFLLALKTVRPLNGEVAICAMKEHVKEIFNIVGFNALFPIFDSTESAIKGLKH